MNEISDKLINVFMVEKPTPTEWRRLLAFSREWGNLRDDFYRRCQERAERESDPGIKLQFLRLGRKLKEVDEDIERHNGLLSLIRKAAPDLSSVVLKHRKDFTKEFFVHLYTVSQSWRDDPAEQKALTEVIRNCLEEVRAHDAASESAEALSAAQLKFQDIIDSPSVDAACKKIDLLSERNELDPALFFILQKAWSTAKETNIVKDDAKEIMYHLYKSAVGNYQKMMPKEVRVLKYLLTIDDADQLKSALVDAFTPGEVTQAGNVDYLYTTPVMLQSLMQMLIDAYKFSKTTTIMRETKDLMNPKVVQRMEKLNKMVETDFM